MNTRHSDEVNIIIPALTHTFKLKKGTQNLAAMKPLGLLHIATKSFKLAD